MIALSVAADASVAAVAEVLASLPVSFAPAEPGATADLIALAGTAEWPQAASEARQAGARAVVIVHPEPADLAGAEVAGVVVIDSAWAGNPAVDVAAPYIAAESAASLLECRLVTRPERSLGADLLDAAALIRRLAGPLSEVRVLHHDAHGFSALGKVGDRAISLSVLRTEAVVPNAYVRLLTDQGGIEVVLPDPSTARPGEVMIVDSDGARTLPTLWESGHRVAWRRAHQLLFEATTTSDLADFDRDQSVAADALRDLAS